MILGFECLGDQYSYSSTPIIQQNINNLSFKNGIYDDLFGSDNAKLLPTEESKIWDYNTKFYAKFENNLMAGNVDYSASIVSDIKVKRKKIGEPYWFTLFNIPINTNDDFQFELFDKYAQGRTDYYYSFVPVINTVEGNINKNEIISEFNNYFILDKDVIYPIIFNTKFNTEINKPGSIVETLGRKYPYVISNGNILYKTGSLSFSLVPMKNCEIDLPNSYSYRNRFETWLMNGKPKIIKDWIGNIYMIKM